MDESSITKHLSAMMDAPYIAVDTESTGLEVKDGRSFGMGISVAYHLGDLGVMSAYFPFRHEEDNLDRNVLMRLQAVLECKPSIYHNLKHDLHTLRGMGINPTGTKLYCSMVLAHMVNEEWPSKELDWLSKVLLKDQKDKTELEKWTKAFGWNTTPVGLMTPYACHDAELALGLFDNLWPNFHKQGLKELWPLETQYIQLLTEVERIGIKVDTAFCERKLDIGAQRMQDIEDELGFKPSLTSELMPFLFDVLNLPILKYTCGCSEEQVCEADNHHNRPAMDKKVMEIYDEMLASRKDRSARLVLEFRGWQKACSALYQSALELISPDGRIRPNFKVHGTKTGRLSCEQPNLQQIPRNSNFPWNGDAKRTFIPDDGYELWEFDYSQLEFRIAANYGNEATLKALFASGEDPFMPLALAVFGSEDYRQKAKTLTYSTLYGAGIARLMAALELDQGGATGVRERFRSYYPGIYKASARASDLAKERGYVRMWTGRRRHFSSRQSTHKAFNSVIQGGAAELVKRAMLRVATDVCDPITCRIVLTVHDSIVLEIAEERVEEVKPRIIKIMSDFPEFDVKLDVEAKKWGT